MTFVGERNDRWSARRTDCFVAKINAGWRNQQFGSRAGHGQSNLTRIGGSRQRAVAANLRRREGHEDLTTRVSCQSRSAVGGIAVRTTEGEARDRQRLHARIFEIRSHGRTGGADDLIAVSQGGWRE